MALEVLVVDDEADIRELVSGVLEDEGYAVRTAADSVGRWACSSGETRSASDASTALSECKRMGAPQSVRTSKREFIRKNKE